MATSKPISTISYNTAEFLEEKLNEWLVHHKIQAWQYITHIGEDGDKDHHHVRIEPNCRLDPMDLTAELKEFTSDHEKPLGCRPWRPSKEEDWFLYALHDKQYLKIKYAEGKDGKLEYKEEDIKVSEGYDLKVAVLRARQSLESHTACMIKELQHGKQATELIEEGKDVFRVQALIKSLKATDYEQLAGRYNDLLIYVDKLESAIKDANLTLEEKDGALILV